MQYLFFQIGSECDGFWWVCSKYISVWSIWQSSFKVWAHQEHLSIRWKIWCYSWPWYSESVFNESSTLWCRTWEIYQCGPNWLVAQWWHRGVYKFSLLFTILLKSNYYTWGMSDIPLHHMRSTEIAEKCLQARQTIVYHFHLENISTVKVTLPLESLLWSFYHLGMPEVAIMVYYANLYIEHPQDLCECPQCACTYPLLTRPYNMYNVQQFGIIKKIKKKNWANMAIILVY